MRKLIQSGPEWKYSSISAKGFFWLLDRHKELTGRNAVLVNRTVFFDETFPVHSVIMSDEEATAVKANMPRQLTIGKKKP